MWPACSQVLVGVWIGGLWNGKLPESDKLVSKAEVCISKSKSTDLANESTNSPSTLATKTCTHTHLIIFSKLTYIRWIQEDFTAETPPGNDSGTSFSAKLFRFRPKSQSCRPKVGVTDPKIRVTAGQSRQTPRIRTGSPREETRMGLGASTEYPP